MWDCAPSPSVGPLLDVGPLPGVEGLCTAISEEEVAAEWGAIRFKLTPLPPLRDRATTL